MAGRGSATPRDRPALLAGLATSGHAGPGFNQGYGGRDTHVRLFAGDAWVLKRHVPRMHASGPP